MIFLGLGSSVGDAEAWFSLAEKALKDRGVQVVRKSTNHHTAPYGGVAKNMFTNAVWQVETGHAPHALLAVLHAVEDLAGRTRDVPWDDRTLDLDLLQYQEEVIDTPSLQVPHPQIEKRTFVLRPWVELVDEDYILPTGLNLHQALVTLEETETSSSR